MVHPTFSWAKMGDFEAPSQRRETGHFLSYGTNCININKIRHIRAQLAYKILNLRALFGLSEGKKPPDLPIKNPEEPELLVDVISVPCACLFFT